LAEILGIMFLAPSWSMPASPRKQQVKIQSQHGLL